MGSARRNALFFHSIGFFSANITSPVVSENFCGTSETEHKRALLDYESTAKDYCGGGAGIIMRCTSSLTAAWKGVTSVAPDVIICRCRSSAADWLRAWIAVHREQR